MTYCRGDVRAVQVLHRGSISPYRFRVGIFAGRPEAAVGVRADPAEVAGASGAECKQIVSLLDSLPAPSVKNFGELLAHAHGAISMRLPRSVHAALLAEAKAEGVSLNQLYLSKLVAQLRAVV
jgi:hypothetical protein